MADVHDIQTRSYNMSRIKGKNTKPEMLALKPSDFGVSTMSNAEADGKE